MSIGMKKFIVVSLIIGLVVSISSVIIVAQVAPKMVDDHVEYMTKQIELANEAGLITNQEADYYKNSIELAKRYKLEQGIIYHVFDRDRGLNESGCTRYNNHIIKGEDCKFNTQNIISIIDSKVQAGQMTEEQANLLKLQLTKNCEQYQYSRFNDIYKYSLCKRY